MAKEGRKKYFKERKRKKERFKKKIVMVMIVLFLQVLIGSFICQYL